MKKLLYFIICALSVTVGVGAEVDFASDVAPILAEHCVGCHSDGNAKGDVSLSTFAHLDENGFIEAGDPDSSYLIELVTSVDENPPEMPQQSAPLSDEKVRILREWIREGAIWPEDLIVREKSKADANWWAYQPLPTDEKSLPHQKIDDYIREKLADHDLTLNPPADRRKLIRRATYDLTGLPPTPEEVRTFIDDPDPKAYEKLIDRLLESPRYGERWGRHWLDVVRFGESNGFERNVIINELWPFRDYVIQSLNDDKPFDQFIREHIAGDVFGKEDPSVAIGTAFLVAGPYDDVGNQDPVQKAQIRANTLDEIISATSGAFLGMTLGCARCHDHKFDPITQEDYYGFYATFSGVRHGRAPLATSEQRQQRNEKVKPLNASQAELNKRLESLNNEILERGRSKQQAYDQKWTRPKVDRMGTEETFGPVTAKFVRFTCEAGDINPAGKQFRIDEFEIWSSESEPRNVALQSLGGNATGKARQIKDFPNAYGPQHVNDGKTGARFISAGPDLTIELAKPTEINRIVFSSARGETTPEHRKFSFVADYRIEASKDGQTWVEIAHGRDRQPANSAHRDHRLLRLESTAEETKQKAEISRELSAVRRDLAKIPPLRQAWIGTRNATDAKGPFNVFLGGSPQKRGNEVVPASLSVLKSSPYKLSNEAIEAERREALANWIVHPDNPLTTRVLANRLWHYHFGTGIVDTPSDFGYMGGRPTHPELLDFLAMKLRTHGWRIKPMHRLIMLSETYRQSSVPRADAGRIDGDSRLLWRFPPRRLSSEEVRDTMLVVAGKLDLKQGGPGFRLYEFMQDNVCTYVPLDHHGPETYRRAIYHQNARASVVDLMTEFDQPDCTFSAPKRTETTTPLQALTMLNHSFTIDMANALAERLLADVGKNQQDQVHRLYQLCYSRQPTADELGDCISLIDDHGLASLCRVLLNTSELIYVQ